MELNYRSVVLPKAFTGLNQAARYGGETNFPARSVEARHCFSKPVLIGEKVLFGIKALQNKPLFRADRLVE